MSVVHLLDTVTEWAQSNICDWIELKQPPADLDAPTDAEYDYKLVNPAAFAMYLPTSEKLPPTIKAPFPALCVRAVAGEDNQAAGSGFVDIQFAFASWDPGLHGEDILKPNGNGTFRRWSGEEAAEYFRRTGTGWRDAWNFVDKALRAVESVSNIGGFTVDKLVPVKFGPMDEQVSIPDLYPTWFAWISFRVNYPIIRNNQDLQNFL